MRWFVIVVAACQPRPGTAKPVANVATVDPAVSRLDASVPPDPCAGDNACARDAVGTCVGLVQVDCPGYEGICFRETTCRNKECCPPR